MNPSPSLFVVPTPIGNLEDITLRAIRVLKEVDMILCEDTRKTGILLKHYGISKKMVAHHQFNEHQTARSLVDQFKTGLVAALVTDAGTPGISDPGFLLIREAIREGIGVETLPGPTAFIPALVDSGIPCDTFFFNGFLPHKKGRQTRIIELAEMHCTIILYESPHRLSKLITQLIPVFGSGRQGAVARELTKIHEEIRRGTLADLEKHFSENPVKGEIVMIISGRET